MSDRIILGPDGRKYITNEPLLHEDKQAAELRRLHALNAELVAALRKAVKLNSFREFNDHIPAMKAALAKVGDSK